MHHPGVEWGDVGACVALEGEECLIDPLFGPANGTCEHAALPVHELRRGIRHHIGAKLHRPLEHWRGKGVVHNRRDAVRPCKITHKLQVNNIKRRVRRALKEEDLGIGADSRFPLRVVGAVDDAGLHAKAREKMIDQPAARPERSTRRDHVVPC